MPLHLVHGQRFNPLPYVGFEYPKKTILGDFFYEKISDPVSDKLNAEAHYYYADTNWHAIYDELVCILSY